MYLSSIKGGAHERHGGLVFVTISHLCFDVNQMSSFFFPPLFYLLPTDADSGRHGCLGSLSAPQPSLHLGDVLLQQFNAVINHAHGGRRAVLDTANRLHKCGGAPAGTENALCRGNTGHCPPWRPARWGDTGVDRFRLFWQPLIGFRRPHVCLISYFISWLGEQDYIWINITEPCLVISLLL